jgi:hypothetical protein
MERAPSKTVFREKLVPARLMKLIHKKILILTYLNMKIWFSMSLIFVI